MTINSVERLTKNNLCFQCGTCKSICPKDAIEMNKIEKRGLIYPKIDKEKCVNCGLCLKVCPINNINLNETHNLSKKNKIGIYNSYDKDRIKYTASGGLITQIISYLFEKKQINKAIVAGMDKLSPTNGKSYIIDNVENLNEISGSIYQPVAVNEILNKISPTDKVAFVGLPCHIRGLELFLKSKPEMKDSFVIKLGLICTIGRGKHGTTLTLKKMGVTNADEVKNIKYRYGEHPGDTVVKLKNNEKKKTTYINTLQNTDYIFMPKGCLFCTDLFNDKADITVGDPWGYVKDKKAMVITRNKIADNILNQMLNENIIKFYKTLTVEETINTQKHGYIYKIDNYSKRVSAYKKIKVATPDIKNFIEEKSSIKKNIGFDLLLFNSIFFNTKVGLKLCSIISEKIIFKYRNKIASINVTLEGESNV